MSYTVLARKYRPQTFEEVYAQDHITRILINAIEMNRVAQAYLFAGPRGVGKTSMARILAKSLNCEVGTSAHPCNKCSNCVQITNGTSQDVVEIDGASNTSVDDVRDLQKDLIYMSATSDYKIYIIDEVHMLSKSAFNALLKTLEEPPDKVIFIFATTEPHKVLPTIISRCQRFDFKSIPVDAIVQRLKDIAEKEQIKTDEESLYIVAQKADGGMRDALSLFDQVISYCNDDITYEKVQDIFGILPYDLFIEIMRNIKTGAYKELLVNFHGVVEAGKDLQEFLNGLMEFIRKLLLMKIGVKLTDVPESMLSMFQKVATAFEENTLLYYISMLMKLKEDIKSGSNSVMLTEIALLKLSKAEEMIGVSDLVERMNNSPFQETTQVSNHNIPEYPSFSKEESPAPVIQEMTTNHNDVEEVAPQVDKVLSTEELKMHWGDVVEVAKKKSAFTGNYLQDVRIVSLSVTALELYTDNKMIGDRIKGFEKELLLIINNRFNSDLKTVNIQVVEKKSESQKFDMGSLETKSPKLAGFVKKTNSVVKQL